MVVSIRGDSLSMTRLRLRWIFLFAAALLGGCDPPAGGRRSSDGRIAILRVAVLDDPVFYQNDTGNGTAGGFEYDLLAAFAERRGQQLVAVPSPSPESSLAMMERGEVDFVAAAPVLPRSGIVYSTPVREAQPLIVRHVSTRPVADVESLTGRSIEVIAGTIPESTLVALAERTPAILLRPQVPHCIDLLGRVANGISELAATDSAHYEMAANYYPDLTIALPLPGQVTYAWAFRDKDVRLKREADAFLSEVSGNGMLEKLHDRYFGHLNRVSPIDATQFIGDMRRILPRYRRHFEQSGAATGIDWRLIAALAYQESKWDPLATSHTGVRGMMMLTEETADALGVSNRLDAAESIRAGAKYLADLADRLAPEVKDPDRIWLALAAYNLGFGHLNGARQLAAGMNSDPNSWYEMKKVLPLMSRPEYYRRLKSGRARGGEAVILVENVRTYYDILRRLDSPRPSLQTGLAMQ
jgi:membrane-bound lytic murein transglycosylase F